MAESVTLISSDKAERYAELVPQIAALVAGEDDLVANLANVCAAVHECLPVASWVGFYRRVGDELVLGPFQGKVACVRIAIGRGVCGSAAARKATVVVDDVEQFPGHIACDAASRSEIVVPVIRDGNVLAVIDVDSYAPGAFDERDARGLEDVARIVAALRW